MTQVLGEILPAALAIAASPFPIIPAILLLFSPRPRASSLSFLLGWVLGILVATVVFVALTSVLEPRDDPRTWTSWARLVLGLVLVVLGLSRWRGRAEARDTPAWMAALDSATPRRALVLGLLLSAANPKILLLAAAGGLAIGAAGLSTADTAAAVLVFTAVGAATVALPVLLYLVLGERVLTPLGRARAWLDEHNSAVMAVVIVAIGLLLTVKGVQGLR